MSSTEARLPSTDRRIFMQNQIVSEPGFFARMHIAFACFGRTMSSAAFARDAAALLRCQPVVEGVPPTVPVAKEAPPEKVHAPALALLSMLQREGRLIDFLQDDVAGYSDADVGSAARVVHEGCRKALSQCLMLEPIRKEGEGAVVSIPAGFDAQRIRLTGNVTGQPPFRGTLKHQGWVAASVKFPSISGGMDCRVIAPAEVEI